MSRNLRSVPGRGRRAARTPQPALTARAALFMALASWPLTTTTTPAAAQAQAPAPGQTGEAIYRNRCAVCHGPSGEGTKDNYPMPLAGKRSIERLTRLIGETMPEDDPGTCVGEEARKVAAYIHGAFYSEEARAKQVKLDARIELSRLTARQYRNAIADLVGSFRPAAAQNDGAPGLEAEYVARGGRRGRGRGQGPPARLQRTDPEIHFDFGPNSPVPEQNALKDLSRRWARLPLLLVPLNVFPRFSTEFRATWRGSLHAPETGDYEFVVRSENAFRLWVNDENRPLIDLAVKSGNDTEHRGTIRLLGGRAYPLRLELSRGKEKTSSIVLLWKPPRRALEVVPRRAFSTRRVPETFVLAAPFPADDRSVGYERGTLVSKEWDAAETDAAFEVAGHVTSRLRELVGVDPNAPADQRAAKSRAFAERFVERAFRRPLSAEQKAFFVDRQFAKGGDPTTALKRVVVLALKSPRFLYREPGQGRPDAFDVASRLSFGLWDSLPDEALRKAAAEGKLATREQVAEQARRMVAAPLARAKLHEFLIQWLRIDMGAEISKDPKLFPDFDQAAISDLRASLEMFLADITGSGSANLRDLLRANYLYLNGRLARLYGVDLPGGAPFQKVELPANERSGVLTHPYLLSCYAYTASSSPIHRGVFLTRSVFGRVLKPPVMVTPPLDPGARPELTTRERVALHTESRSCQMCHRMINPLGFTLEHYDAIGRYRDRERGRPIDATGGYETLTGDRVSFRGLEDLTAYLARSDEVHAAFAQQLFHYLVKQPIAAFGRGELEDLRRTFESGDDNIRKLMVAIMATSALAPRSEEPRADQRPAQPSSAARRGG